MLGGCIIQDDDSENQIDRSWHEIGLYILQLLCLHLFTLFFRKLQALGFCCVCPLIRPVHFLSTLDVECWERCGIHEVQLAATQDQPKSKTFERAGVATTRDLEVEVVDMIDGKYPGYKGAPLTENATGAGVSSDQEDMGSRPETEELTKMITNNFHLYYDKLFFHGVKHHENHDQSEVFSHTHHHVHINVHHHHHHYEDSDPNQPIEGGSEFNERDEPDAKRIRKV